MAGVLASGDIRFGTYDSTGEFNGFGKVYNGVTIEVVPGNDEPTTRKSKGRNNYGSVLDSVSKNATPVLNIAVDDIDDFSLALATNGTASDVAIAAASFTDLPVTLKHDRWIETGHMNLDAAGFQIADDAAGTTVYVEGTDYEVDLRTGMVKALASGNIAHNQAVFIDGAILETTGYQVEGSTNGIGDIYVYFDGKDLNTDEDIEMRVPKVPLKPAAGMNFLSDDYIQASLTGTPKVAPGFPGGYRIAKLKRG